LKLLRKTLIRLLGFKNYLRLVSKSYLGLVQAGLLQKQYPELFFLRSIIRPGFYCLDIGANLGYYSTFLSQLAGPKGKVFAVEPIPLFQDIWRQNVKQSGVDNLVLYPYALGTENTTVRMGTPERDGLLRHGMTKVVASAQEIYGRTYAVEMRVPDELFADLSQLDFIKCDVEGFEYQVFAALQGTIRRFKPLIQTELNGVENRLKVARLLQSLGYGAYILTGGETLEKCTEDQLPALGKADFYFKMETT
jgi:FkbM family methyltransferase